MVGDALLDIIFAPEENDGVGMLIGEPDLMYLKDNCNQELFMLTSLQHKLLSLCSQHQIYTSLLLSSLQTLAVRS